MSRFFWVALALGLAACEGCGAADEPVGNVDSTSPPPSSGTATLVGTIRIPEGAELPQYPDQPMIGGAGRASIPDFCTPPQISDRTPVTLAGDRALVGVLVAVADFAREIPHEPRVHEVSITDCRLNPRLIVAMRGDTLRLTNATDYPYLPDLGGGMLQAVMHNRSRDIELAQGGIRTLTCGFAAPCGRAEIVTLYHPLYAVTDAQGHYRIEGIPAGEEIRVNAWHPLFAESNETITLQADETRTIDFVITPAAPRPAPEPPAEGQGHPEDDPNNVLF